jgi:hypothetical protein
MLLSKHIIQNLLVKGQTVSPENMDGSHWEVGMSEDVYLQIYVCHV